MTRPLKLGYNYHFLNYVGLFILFYILIIGVDNQGHQNILEMFYSFQSWFCLTKSVILKKRFQHLTPKMFNAANRKIGHVHEKVL